MPDPHITVETVSDETVEKVMQQASEPPPGLIKPATVTVKPTLTPAEQAIKERLESPLTLTWFGIELTVPPLSEWEFKFRYFGQSGRDVDAMLAMFGAEQMDAIMASEHATTENVGSLVMAVMEFYQGKAETA